MTVKENAPAPTVATLYTSAKRLTETYKDWTQHQERVMRVDWSTEWTYQDFIAWFRQCLSEKINRQDARNTWRKCSPEYQRNLEHDALIIKQYYASRIRHGGRNILNTKEMQSLYPEINCPQDW